MPTLDLQDAKSKTQCFPDDPHGLESITTIMDRNIEALVIEREQWLAWRRRGDPR